jgi:hypothetical protein
MRPGLLGLAIPVLSVACQAVPPASPRAGEGDIHSVAAPEPAGVDGQGAGFAALQALIESRGIRSIDELVPALPESLRSRHVLVFESRSVQGASRRSPRAILYTHDGRFVATFNGESDQAGYRSLETMEFDGAARSFRFREVTFPEGASARFSELDPPRCLACHGDDPRPIWDAYPVWPGVYSGPEDASPGADEATSYAAFFEARDSSPRYRQLAGLRPATDARAERATVGSAAYEGKSQLSANAQFGVLLQALAFHVIAREVTASPRYRRHRYALLAALDAQCLQIEGFVPPSERAMFTRGLDQFERETSAANANEDARKDARMRDGENGARAVDAVPRESLTTFRYLVEEALGLPTRDWTLALEKATYDFTSPRPLARVLEADLLDAMGPADGALRVLRRGGDGRDDYCAVLRRKSLAELSSSVAAPR